MFTEKLLLIHSDNIFFCLHNTNHCLSFSLSNTNTLLILILHYIILFKFAKQNFVNVIQLWHIFIVEENWGFKPTQNGTMIILEPSANPMLYVMKNNR